MNVSEQFEIDSKAAGFYAIAYTVPGGAVEGITTDTTVISYRGTDAPTGSEAAGGGDLWRGWSVGAGRGNSDGYGERIM